MLQGRLNPRSTEHGTRGGTQRNITSLLGRYLSRYAGDNSVGLRLRKCYVCGGSWQDLDRHLAFAHGEVVVAWL